MKLELVSFKICPYVQRSIITLLHKEVEHTVTHITPGKIPDWFKKISPTGKVPLLKVDDEHIIFESAVINEFIDEISEGSLHPEDPVLKAKNRAWIEYGSECLVTLQQIISVPIIKFHDAHKKLLLSMARLERNLGDGPYFNGDDFSLVDAAYAPFFLRLGILTSIKEDLFPSEKFPKVEAWSRQLLKLPPVTKSVVPEFPKLYIAFILKRKGNFASFLPREW